MCDYILVCTVWEVTLLMDKLLNLTFNLQQHKLQHRKPHVIS